MTRLTMMSLLAIVALTPACDSSRQKQDAGITRDVPADGDATNGSAGDCHTAFEVWCEDHQKCVFLATDSSNGFIEPASPDAGVQGTWTCVECVKDGECPPGERCLDGPINWGRCSRPVDEPKDTGLTSDVGDDTRDAGDATDAAKDAVGDSDS